MKKTLLALAMLLCALPLFAQAVTYSAKVSWTAPVSLPGTGYNVYKSSVTGACAAGLSTCTKLTASPISALTFTDSGLTAGSTTFYVVKSVSAVGVESDASTEGVANLSKPNAPGGVSVTVTVSVTTP